LHHPHDPPPPPMKAAPAFVPRPRRLSNDCTTPNDSEKIVSPVARQRVDESETGRSLPY
jgi:hypothetical protein